MTDRPKPPSPYKTWIDYILGAYAIGDVRDYALVELNELRAEIAELKSAADNAWAMSSESDKGP